MTVEALLEDPAEGSAPTLAALRPLIDAGCSIAALTMPLSIRVARVTIDGGAYVPNPVGTATVFIVPVLGPDGVLDLVAWRPRTMQLACRLGVGACLGEGQIGRDGCGTTGMPLQIWRSPIGWFRAGRQGVVIIDAERAAHRLAGLAIAAEDVRHATQLRERLTLPAPRILVPGEMKVAA